MRSSDFLQSWKKSLFFKNTDESAKSEGKNVLNCKKNLKNALGTQVAK